MKSGVWDQAAEDWHDTVLSPLGEDRSGFLKRAVAEAADPKKTVIDLGCGVGHWAPLLAGKFKSVVGVDFSQKCVDVAAKKYAKLTNVSFLRSDLAVKSPPLRGQRFDFAVLCNSLLDGRFAWRAKAMRTLADLLKPNGTALIVVPSLESFLYTRQLEARGRTAWSNRKQIVTQEGTITNRPFLHFLQGGVVRIDGEDTKYFLQQELAGMASAAGLEVRKLGKVEYEWTAVSDQKLAGRTTATPWDWGLVVGHAGGTRQKR